MKQVTFILLAAALAFASCKQDSENEGEQASPSEANPTTTQGASQSSMKVKGFNFLTDCDSLVVSKLVLTGPNGEGDFAYLKGDCATGSKSFELLLVPRAGATPAAAFGNPTEVLAKAAANDYKDYLCYAFEIPKHHKANASGELEIVDLFPINAVIRRLDNSTWVRLGQDRADDLSAYNTLRWNILHDNMPQYD